MLIAQLCPTLCDIMDCSLPGPSVHGILQARIPEWVAIPFSRGSTWPRDWIWVCGIAGRSPEPPGKPLLLYPEMSRSPTSDLPWCWTSSHCSLSLHFAWPVNSTWHRSRSLFTSLFWATTSLWTPSGCLVAPSQSPWLFLPPSSDLRVRD